MPDIELGPEDAKMKKTWPLPPYDQQTTPGLTFLLQTSDSFLYLMGNVFNGLLCIKSVWDQLVFTLLFLKLIASHYVTSEPCDAWRLTAGHLEEGKSLAVVKTCWHLLFKEFVPLGNSFLGYYL